MTAPQDFDRTNIESEIRNNFNELKKRLDDLKKEVQSETDNSKKQQKESKIQQLENDLNEIQTQIDRLSTLQDQELQALKTKLQDCLQVKQDTQGETTDLLRERNVTPTTYELLKNSETCTRLLNIIESNPKEFKKLPWETPEAKLEYMFSKIRNWIVLFMKNKLWNSENIERIINNTIAPAMEWSLMELLRDQWNEANISMLKWMNRISRDNLQKLVSWVSKFARTTTWSYNKFNAWMNAIDYLSVHNWVFLHPEKSAVLSNPLEFQKYINDSSFSSANFSPYAPIHKNIFKIDNSQSFGLWMSLEDKQEVLREIGNIQVVNNPKTTSLIAKMIDKPEQFLWATSWLQQTANGLLNGLNAISSVTKIFWYDVLWEVTKAPAERSFMYKILDFVCKLIWITWWMEWIVKRWRLDRLELTDAKNENINQIFKEYHDLVWNTSDVSITDEASCKTVLSDFDLNDLDDSSSTKWDHLRDVAAKNINISLVSPSVVQQTIWESYLKKETKVVNWETQEKVVIDESKITDDVKKELMQAHINNMKSHLEENYADLKDFYSNIHSSDDIALCMLASLYADKNDVIEWIKAKVFLPENYWVVYEWNYNNWNEDWNSSWRENLDSRESADKQTVSEQWIYDKAVEYGITDKNQIAYVLSTVKWECGFKNQKEIWWENKSYWAVDSQTWKAYYGRWFIQLTHKSNYERYTQIIRESWKDFRDNNWNLLKWNQIDLVNNPDIILQSNDLAAFIIMDCMKNWWPDRVESKRLDHYINETKTDFYNARMIINWRDKQQLFADNAQAYADKLWKWSVDTPIETNDLLVWPHLLAHNKDEIWWLWNSIMNGFQWMDSKTYFPNMDGVVWKNTTNHPRRFQSQNDVISYKNSHPNVKSFMFYFWENSRDSNQTLSDIKQWSEWFQSEWIQPVLCTCIWSDKHDWLQTLNSSLLALWRDKNYPVINFDKPYKDWEIQIWSDSFHPTSYASMTSAINSQLSQS